MIRILVAEDNRDIADGIVRTLARCGYECYAVKDGMAALDLARTKTFDLALLDVRMPRLDGISVLKELKKLYPSIPVILMTAIATLEGAVEAMRGEAADYLVKPFTLQEMETRVLHVLQRIEAIRGEVQSNHVGVSEDPVVFVGESQTVKKIRELIQKVSPASSAVLISGESGTGKEVLAREIHNRSPRRSHPFVAINCVTLSEGLLESELFGHEKGAFTGAISQKKGLLEVANHGTVFLDEIGEISPAIQVKLLRFLQEHEIQRVGGTRTITVDVRIIAATNRNLEEDVKLKKFREDLWYRLNVFEIVLPPLRERVDDVNLLIQHFVDKYQKILRKNASFSPEAVDALRSYSWPGNVRELENVIERALVLAQKDEVIGVEELLPRLMKEGHTRDNSGFVGSPKFMVHLRDMERGMILQALERTQWNQTQAARQLGLKRSTLQYRMQKYGLLHNKTNPAG